MGHDIYAFKREYRNGEVREAKYVERVETRSESEDWSDAYNDYANEVRVSYFRRSMGYYRGPAGALLYEVLGKKAQQCYGGVSGTGEDAIFGLEELLMARELCRKKMRDQQLAQEDIDDEVDFLTDCINYAEKDERREVLIHFG